MSQHGDPEPVRTVIRKVRAACGDVEVVYLDVCTSGDRHPDARREFHRTLGEWAAADRFAVYDMTTRLEQYFAAAGRPREWFLRDTHHVNDRGRQVLARLWAAFFAPDGAGAPG
jgi:hypothetical protein